MTEKQRDAVMARVFRLVDKYEDEVTTPEAEAKFESIVIARNGYKDHSDVVAVMGYFDPVEGEAGYDLSLETLGNALRKLKGVKVIMETDLVYDGNTQKLVIPR